MTDKNQTLKLFLLRKNRKDTFVKEKRAFVKKNTFFEEEAKCRQKKADPVGNGRLWGCLITPVGGLRNIAIVKDMAKYKYRPFHKTLPRSSAFVNWISVRFNETESIIISRHRSFIDLFFTTTTIYNYSWVLPHLLQSQAYINLFQMFLF